MAKQRHLFFDRIQSVLTMLMRRKLTKILHYLLLLLLLLGTAILPVIAQTTTSQAQSSSPIELVEQSRMLYESGQFSESIDRLEDAELAFATAEDVINQAMTLINLALAYQQLEQWQAAQQALTKSFDLLGTAESIESLRLLAQAWLVQGKLQLATGQPEAALNAWQQAEAQSAQAGDRATEVSSQIYQSLALQELGFHLRALRLLVSPAPNRSNSPMQWLQTQPDSLIKVAAFQSLGNVLRLTNNAENLSSFLLSIPDLEGDEVDYLKQSRRVLQQSLLIAERLRSPREAAQSNLSLGNTARVTYAQSKDAFDRALNPALLNQAQTHLTEAINFYEQANTPTATLHTQIEAQLNQLRLAIDHAHWLQSVSAPRAEAYRREATDRLQAYLDRLPLLEAQINRLPASRSAVYIKINLAQSLIKQYAPVDRSEAFPNAQRIQQLLEISVSQAQALQDQRAEAYALGNLAALYEKTGVLDSAQSLSEVALQLADDLQALDIAYQWQWQLGRILKQQGSVVGAIAAYQEAIKTLATLRTDLAGLNNPDAPFSFRDDVEPVYRQLIELLLPRDRFLAEVSALTSENNQSDLLLLFENPLESAIRAVEDLQVLELENFLRCRLQNTTSLAIDQSARQEDRETAIIYPIVLSDRLEILLKLPNQDRAIRRTADVSQVEVEAAVADLREAIESKETAQQSSEVFGNLYRWLFRQEADSSIEVELQNSNIKTLVFVLDGALKNIPLPALYDNQQQQYLIQKPYSIAVNLGQQFIENRRFRKDFNVLAAGVSVANLGRAELPNVDKELEQIESLAASNQVLLNQQFTPSKLEEEVESETFSIVHLATHGQFSSSLQQTYLLAYEEPINVEEIRSLLRRREETQINPIELLVLSACQTAQGDKRATLGIAGISVQAGAQRTIASLFNVNDASTATLMDSLYQQLRDRNIPTVSEALRQAQLALLQGENTEEQKPYHWSPFILVGNWR